MTEILDFLKNYWTVLSGLAGAVIAVGGWLVLNSQWFGNRRELKKIAKECYDLLLQIKTANDRIIVRGRAEGGHWARLQNDNYNDVCARREVWRRTEEPPREAYYAVIFPDPDLGTVCIDKWILGQRIDDYRNMIEKCQATRFLLKLYEHNDFQMLIRRSVVQPDFMSPKDLEAALDTTIAGVKPFGKG